MKNKIFKNSFKYMLIVVIAIFLMINIGLVAKSAEEIIGIKSESWMALIGVLIGQLISYLFREYERDMDEKKEIKMVESIINNFLSKEINDNFKLIPISSMKEKLKELRSGSENKQFGFSGLKFQFSEYDKVKYEIIKYNNKSTLEVLEIYNLFYFLMDKQDFKNMNIAEIEKIVSIYDKYVDKYLIII